MIFGIQKSIFRRLLISCMITVLLGLCAVGLLVAFVTKGYIVDSKQTELLRMAKKVNLSIQQTDHIDDNAKKLLLFFDQSFDARIWVFDSSGAIVATSTQDEVYIGKKVGASVVSKVMNGETATLHVQTDNLAAPPMLSVVVPWGKDNLVYGGIVLHAPITSMNETIRNIRETILWATLCGIVLSGGIASYLSWTISRPLRAMDRVAVRIGSGEYGERVRISSKDEIGELAETINRMAEKLERLDLEKKKSEQSRSEALANVSHELRTPLTAMQGFLEALQDGLIDETAREKYIDILYNETLHMNRLVDDLLDLMKIENHAIRLECVPLDVAALLSKVAFKFMKEAEERGTSLGVYVDGSLPKLYADYDRIEQILNNLVKNALKFTENGRISLTAVAVGEQREWIRISVQDTGVGIAERDRELIWDRFYKLDTGTRGSRKGSGLGLAIVKQLVKLHNGTIDVESEPGVGSTFTLHLPALRQTEEEEPLSASG